VTDSLRRLFWLLGVAFVLHELEEWNLGAWERSHFSPPPEISDRDLRTLLVLFAALGLGFTALALRFLPPRAATLSLLALFVAVVFGNALTHLFWLFQFGGYGPGAATVGLLLLPLTLALLSRVIRERAAPRAYAIALIALALLQPIGAAAGGSTLSGSQLALQNLGAGLGRWLWGPG
jgi:hypothetical protein